MEFPRFKPNWWTENKFQSDDYRKRYKALRNASSAFIAKIQVKDYIFKRDNCQCILCGSNEKLQIDHIISVYMCAIGKISIAELNIPNNLRTVCKKCHLTIRNTNS